MDSQATSEWLSRISSDWGSTVASLVETGTILIMAEDALGDELTTKLENELPFSPIVAAFLKRIALHPILKDPSYFHQLPSNYNWLFYLSTIEADELSARIESGQISPDYTLDPGERPPTPNEHI